MSDEPIDNDMTDGDKMLCVAFSPKVFGEPFDAIRDDLLKHVGVPFVVGGVTTAADTRGTRRKRRRTLSILAAFVDVMASEKPPATREELIARVTPIVGFVLSMLFRALFNMVINYLWERRNNGQ